MSDVPAYQDENGIWRNEYGEEVAPGDPNQTATILEPEGHAGAWDDGHGGQNYGAEGEIARFGYESTNRDGTDANASVLGVKGEAYVGDHGFGIGTQANISEGSFSEQQFDPNQQGESHVTGGVSWVLEQARQEPGMSIPTVMGTPSRVFKLRWGR